MPLQLVVSDIGSSMAAGAMLEASRRHKWGVTTAARALLDIGNL